MTAAYRALAASGPFGFGFAVLIGLTVVVEAMLVGGIINRFIVPLPSEIIASVPRIIAEEDILGRFLTTCQECLYAMLLLSVIGIAAGALIYRFATLRAAIETWIAALASAPIVLMYPLFLVVFGRTTTTIVVMGLIAGLPPVILKTIEGLAGTRSVLLDVGRSFNLTPWQMFSKVHFPASLPSIFVGLRLGLFVCLINIVGVEFLINFGGLGQVINDLAERYDLPGMYAAISFVILVSVLFFIATERIERALRPLS